MIGRVLLTMREKCTVYITVIEVRIKGLRKVSNSFQREKSREKKLCNFATGPGGAEAFSREERIWKHAGRGFGEVVENVSDRINAV